MIFMTMMMMIAILMMSEHLLTPFKKLGEEVCENDMILLILMIVVIIIMMVILVRVRQKCPKCMKSTIPSWILFQLPHTMSEHFSDSMADH